MFEFDPNKSENNRNKHGIDFEEATELWNDSNRVVLEARTSDEQRHLMIAKKKDIYWSAIYTVRDNNIRIISVRKSRKNEREIYNRG